MPRRTQLKGVAANIAQFCTSRNFDFEGYWAMGVLYKLAESNNSNAVTLNVTERTMNLYHSRAASIVRPLNEILRRGIISNNIPEEWVSEATAKFKFNVEFQAKYHFWGSALGGAPYLCSLSIRTDLGRDLFFTTGGNVRIHDPARESRRYGF